MRAGAACLVLVLPVGELALLLLPLELVQGRVQLQLRVARLPPLLLGLEHRAPGEEAWHLAWTLAWTAAGLLQITAKGGGAAARVLEQVPLLGQLVETARCARCGERGLQNEGVVAAAMR